MLELYEARSNVRTPLWHPYPVAPRGSRHEHSLVVARFIGSAVHCSRVLEPDSMYIRWRLSTAGASYIRAFVCHPQANVINRVEAGPRISVSTYNSDELPRCVHMTYCTFGTPVVRRNSRAYERARTNDNHVSCRRTMPGAHP